MRFVPVYFKHSVVAFVLGILIYNSMGFLAPWYAETHREAVETQAYGPLVEYLGTRDVQEIVWSDVPTADFIPIYTAHSAPNSINLGSYPIPQSFLDNRFFLEYRLRGVAPKDFEGTIRSEAAHVSARLWGLWLRETKGDETAIPEEEFSRIAADYAVFHKKSWSENFDALDITLVAARTADRAPYDAIPALKETATVGDFVIYKRL